MESKEWSAASHEQHNPGANNRLHCKYKMQGASHNSVHIWSSRTTKPSFHCLQNISTEIVQDKLQWDELLPVHLQWKWNQPLQTIPKLSQLKINRRVICSIAINIQIRGFCDSSERACGACLYFHSTDNNNRTSCELLCSTSNVAPLKQLRIPRLELCVATLLSMLYKKVIHTLNMTINESYLWTDSSILLTWIQGPPNKWKTLVGTELPSFKKKQLQLHGDMCHLNPILLILCQEKLNLQHFQHPHTGGKDHNGFHRSHPAGQQQRSTLPQNT